MTAKGAKTEAGRWYRGADVPLRVIRRYARQVAERFRPDRIILFGSHAYGTPHADSDVDILVVMPCRNQHDQAVKIRLAVERSFAMDLLVRTPANLAWRLAERESFHTEIVTRGIVLYEKKRASGSGTPRPTAAARNFWAASRPSVTSLPFTANRRPKST